MTDPTAPGAAPTTTPVEVNATPAPASSEVAAARPSEVAPAATLPPEFTIHSPKARKLSDQYGLSLEASVALLSGQTSLERALKNLKSRAELARLTREHKLPHSIAGQVLKGQMTIEQALCRKNVLEHREHYFTRCSFAAAAQSQEDVVLGLHGQELVTAKIRECMRYDIRAEIADVARIIPKHSVKFICKQEHSKVLRKVIKPDKSLTLNPRGPITKIKERFKVRDELLQGVIDLKSHVIVTLLEGEKIAGEVLFYSQYEIALGLKDEAQVYVFRHAVQNAEAVPLEEVLAAERYAKKMATKKAQPPGKGKKKH